MSSGSLADAWGAGNFLAVSFAGIDTTGLTSLKIGPYPSATDTWGTEALGDPDMDGVFKITDKDAQVLRVVATDGERTVTKDYRLDGLVCEGA